MANKAVFCISTSEAQASEIVSQLKEAGFLNNDISALLPDKTGNKDFAHEHHTKAPEGATSGGFIGLLTGALLGWLTSLGVLHVPGLAPYTAAGPLMTALSVAALGAIAGGLIGGLIGLGMPEYEARRYQGKIHEGNILISVHADTGRAARRARRIFRKAGARHVSTRAEASVRQSYQRPLESAAPNA